jgi:hypothetical protein
MELFNGKLHQGALLKGRKWAKVRARVKRLNREVN